MKHLLILFLLLVLIAPAVAQEGGVSATPIGTYNPGVGEGGSEIVAYDPANQTMFITNGAEDTIDAVSIADPANPELLQQISLEEYGPGVNSVAVSGGIGAAAVEGEAVDSTGTIVFFDTATFEVLAAIAAGVLPDMVTFTPDGTKVISANEGEPNDDYSIDPEGSVTVIDISGGVENLTEDAVTLITFEAFNADGDRAAELGADVRIFGPEATVAQDLEPEYVAVSPDSTTAFVVAQENNAMIVIDLTTNEIVAIGGLGTKDYSLQENAIDASNEDGEINIQTWPVQSYYMPDAIAAYEADGAVYIVTANEGDARDYETFSEEARVADLTLDPEVFPNAEELQQESNLGRLNITTTAGDEDGDGDYEAIYGYGARSFTIWNTDLEVVFDSGNDFEEITAERTPESFNSNGLADSFDSRSDDKGPEPESLAIGTIDGVTYAFIGMERVGGFFVYDITDPSMPAFVDYFNNINIDGSIEEGTAGDVSPEGMAFVSAEDSPTGNPLLIVAYEITGTTTVWELTPGM